MRIAKWLISAVRFYSRASNPVLFLGRQFLRRAAASFPHSSGCCLDVGAGTAPYRSLAVALWKLRRYVAVDVAPTDTTDVVGDACLLPFRAESFDIVVSFDTIQHIRDPGLTIDEIRRVVRIGGYFLLTFPFLYAECDFHDYQRWTIEGMTSALRSRGFDVVLEERRGGAVFAITCGIVWLLQHIIPGQRRSWRARRNWISILRSAIVACVTLPFVVASWGGLLIDKIFPSTGAYMGGAILARRTQ